MVRVRPRPLAGRPRVSVTIPCYNYGHFLTECVRTVLDQENVDVDVLIVDDASPDGSGGIAERLAASDPRVRAIARSENWGHIRTFNQGLDALDGEFVVLLSADDLLAPGSLARSAALMRAYPEVGMVYGFAPSFTDTPPPARTATRSWTVWPGAAWIERICLNGGNPVTTPEVMMRMSTMRQLVGYDARVPHACDFLMWLRAAAVSSIGRLNGVDQAYYRVHGLNMHTEQYGGAVTDLSQRHQAFEIFFDENATDLPDAPRLRAAARWALSQKALGSALACLNADPASVDTKAAAELAELAISFDPAAATCRLMATYERNLRRVERGIGPVVPKQVTAATRRVRHHLGWRRRRLTGVEAPLRPARGRRWTVTGG
jgi:glycosyltransferase involved in cell wall biosynthesis